MADEKLLNPMWAYRKKWLQTEKGQVYRNCSRQKYYEKTAFNRNYHRRWTEAEEIMVISHRLSDTELSENLGRSVGSIQRKRHNLKKKLGYTE